MINQILTPEEIDQRLNWPAGRAQRMARQRRLPFILLPDGEFRFEWSEIERLLVRVAPCGCEVPAA